MGELTLMKNYHIVGTVGSGSFAKLKVAQNLVTGDKVVLKFIRTGRGVSPLMAEREKKIMERLHHPNVMPLLATIKTKGQIVLVMPFIQGGDLRHYVMHHGPMTEGQARMVFRQLAAAVQYCHACGICHRDIKPENVLLDHSQHVILCDFGLSHDVNHAPMQGFCGTKAYMAPEVTEGGVYGLSVDIWNMGVVLHILVAGYPPFVPGRYWKRFDFPPKMSSKLRWLLEGMLKEDPGERSDWDTILNHPWMTKHFGPVPKYVEPTHPCDLTLDIKPDLPHCLVLSALLFPRRLQSCPPVLVTSPDEQQQFPLPTAPKYASLSLQLNFTGPAHLLAPPNTPCASWQESVPLESCQNPGEKRSLPPTQRPQFSPCSSSSSAFTPVHQGRIRTLLSYLLRLCCSCCAGPPQPTRRERRIHPFSLRHSFI